jgi:ribonuclease D
MKNVMLVPPWSPQKKNRIGMSEQPLLYIDSSKALEEWLKLLRDAEVIGVDTESDSFHHYREKVCLIQMTALGRDVIIDPLAVRDLSSLTDVFASQDQVKIFHDACYDLACLKRDFQFEVNGIFDTMVAGRMVGARQFGLAPMLKAYFDFELDKRWQRSDWAARPLASEQIQYARYDTHFLPALRDVLMRKLTDMGRLTWALEDFARLPETAARIPARSGSKDPDAFWRLTGVKNLSPDEKGRARALHLLREGLAERIDRPPFRVFHDDVLMSLAIDPPHSLQSFRPRPGFRDFGIQRYGARIVAALQQAKPVYDEPKDPRRKKRSGRFLDGEAKERYEDLRKLRAQKATALGLDPEVLLSNASVEALAVGTADLSQISELQTWRKTILGDLLLGTAK